MALKSVRGKRVEAFGMLAKGPIDRYSGWTTLLTSLIASSCSVFGYLKKYCQIIHQNKTRQSRKEEENKPLLNKLSPVTFSISQ